jgi:hypothetical protein
MIRAYLEQIGFWDDQRPAEEIHGDSLMYFFDKYHENLETFLLKSAYYKVLKDNSGVEVWGQFSSGYTMLGFNPFFRGRSTVLCNLVALYPSRQNNLDVMAHLRLPWREANHKNTSLLGNVPDYYLKPLSYWPQKVLMRLTLFADYLRRFNSSQEFEAHQALQETLFPIKSLNTLLSEKDFNFVYAQGTSCIASGYLLAKEICYNRFTQKKFLWLLLETQGGTLDVVTRYLPFGEHYTLGCIVEVGGMLYASYR